MTLQIIALLINLAVAIIVSLAALGKTRLPVARSIVLLALFTGAWILCDVLLKRSSLVSSYAFLTAAIYLSATLAASAQFTYVVWQSNRQHWVTRLPSWWLAVMPVLTQLLFWVKPWHDLLFGTGGVGAGAPLFLGTNWGKVVALYIFCLIGGSVLLLWNAFFERPRSIFMPFSAVLIGSLLPAIAAGIGFAGFLPFAPSELLPIGFTLAAVTYTFYFFVRRADTIASIDRNAVVEGMDDGWMVLDNQNIVVDMNSAAERLAGLPREQVLGKPVTTTLSGLPAGTYDLFTIPTSGEYGSLNLAQSVLIYCYELLAGFSAPAAEEVRELAPGDSLEEMVPRFQALRRARLQDVKLDNSEHIWWD